MSATSWRTVPLPSDWPAIRYEVLFRDPVCRWGSLDGEEGTCGQDATEADHTGSPSDHRPEMLRGLCHSHHVHRSAGQARARKAAIASARLRPRDSHPGYKVLPSAAEGSGG